MVAFKRRGEEDLEALVLTDICISAWELIRRFRVCGYFSER